MFSHKQPAACSIGLAAIACTVLVACRPPAPSPGDIQKFSDDFVHQSLALSPIQATAAGYHHYAGVDLDDQLDDYSHAGISRALTFYDHSLGQVSNYTSSAVPVESESDLEIIREQCEREVFSLDKLQEFRHNPTIYVEAVGNALYHPFILGYAPAEQRYSSIIARLEKIPAFVHTAAANLEDSPLIWNQVAQKEDQGDIDLIENTIRPKIPPDLQDRYNRAAASATAALASFASFLKNDLSHRQSDWRLGRDNYAAKFRLTFSSAASPQQVLTDAEGALESTRQNMDHEAASLYGKYFPGKPPSANPHTTTSQVLAKIAEIHAAPADYFSEAKADLAEATTFVESHHLVPLLSASHLQVIPTPEFMRGLYSVGGFAPAPVLEPTLGSFYWITPFTPDMTPARIESKLREYNRYGLQLLTIHEAMPGHYVQFEYADRVQPESRRVLRGLFSDGPYVEGWAVHATELMMNAGYERSPEMQLTWEKHLLRVISNAILDIKLQTENMTDQQALDLMINGAFQEKEEAEEKLQRAKLSSCQLPTYFVGWRAWDRLQADYQRRKGQAFQVAQFNQTALKEGAIPLIVLRRVLMGES